MLLFYAIPVRTYQSVWFRAKVIMLILAAINIWYFHYRVYPQKDAWDTDAGCRGRRAAPGWPR